MKTCNLVFANDTPGEEVIVLDHMAQYGWRDAFNKKKGLTLDYAKLVVGWMAKFHGMNHVLMKRYDAIHGKGSWLNANKWTESFTKIKTPEVKTFWASMRKKQEGNFLNMARIIQEEDGSS